MVCEFSSPHWAPFRTLYIEYLMKALPSIARAVSSSPDAYVYLAESIRVWSDQRQLADRITEAGWQRPRWRNLSGGIVALHHAIARPAPPGRGEAGTATTVRTRVAVRRGAT